jgi:putative transposase
MRRERFRKGLEIKWRNRNFIIENRNEDGDIQLRDTLSNEFLTFPDSKLIDALFDGELEIINRNFEDKGQLNFVADLSLVSDSAGKEAKYRFAYVDRVVKKGVNTLTRNTLEPLIKEVASEIFDSNPPSWISLYRWTKSYINSSCDLRALIPKVRIGNTKHKFGKQSRQKFSASDQSLANEAAKLVEEAVKEIYLTPQRLSVQATYDLLLVKLSEINHFRSAGEKIPIPSNVSIYKYISKLDDYEKDRSRLGKRIADQKHAQRGLGPRPTRPLERTEIDHTKLDEVVIDDNNWLPLGRPWVTTLIDKFSSMPLGRHVGFEPPCSNTVLQCLRHSIKRKTYLRQQFPNIQNDWETYGLPETIAGDNGLEFLGKHYADALLQLRIHIDYSPVRMPWYKAGIERFFGVQNKQLLHRLPGTTFSNIFEKGDYDPEKNALITFSAFLEILDTWIVDIYSQEIRRGYEQTGPNKIPALAWREGIAEFPPALPPKNLDLDVLLRMIEYRTVDQGGIELFSLRYNAPELALIRRELKGEKVMVKYDSSDLSLIYVADKRFGKYIPVPALDQNYSRGLSLYQHEIIKKYTRNYLKSKVNEESLIKAKKRVQEIVNEEMTRTKKMGTRVRAARFAGISSKERSEIKHSPEDHRYLTASPLPMLPPSSLQEETLKKEITENIANDSDVSKMPANKTYKKKSKTKVQNNKDTSVEDIEVDSDVEMSNEHIDMTGWSAGFDLPMKK